jgi:hypothetical protein
MQLPARARCPGSGTMEAWEGQRASKIRVAQVPSRTSPRQDKIALQTQQRSHASSSSKRSARKSKFAAAGPAARRFVAAATPTIMVPEKASERARPSRKPSLAGMKTAKNRTPESGATVATKRVRVPRYVKLQSLPSRPNAASDSTIALDFARSDFGATRSWRPAGASRCRVRQQTARWIRGCHQRAWSSGAAWGRCSGAG